MTINKDDLLAAGFAEKTYENQVGIFIAKSLKAWDMPYMKEHVIDGEYIFEDSDVVVEVTPRNEVQLFVAHADYLEGPYPVDSEDGHALLKDAGYNV
jgi:hypothetical protein